MTLRRYNDKRNFKVTAEPKGILGKHKGFSFVVQQHAARRMHYDLRLEIDGVLKSWAIPKGPSFNPNDKRLAVQTEDHPLAYAQFEGIIPPGEYGGGRMIVWDAGQWQPLLDPNFGVTKGHLAFTLFGQKLKGAWHLIRMGDTKSKNWLLAKVDDGIVDPNIDITVCAPHSVVSGYGVDEIDSHQHALPTQRQPQNTFATETIRPQLATRSDQMPTTLGWAYEVKLDGYRLMATRSGDAIKLLTRSGHDWTHKFASIAAAVAHLTPQNFMLDGELVYLTADGKSDFAALQKALDEGNHHKLCYCVFDLLGLQNKDLRALPLQMRKRKLKQLLEKAPLSPNLLYWHHVSGNAAGKKAFEAAQNLGLEGIMAKRTNAPYVMGRTADWLKIKCVQRQEFVVGGFRSESKMSAAIRSLLLGVYASDGSLQYVGKVGTGLGRQQVQQLAKLFAQNTAKKSPFADRKDEPDVIWLRPKIVVEIQFSQWTPEGHLRHASFIALREDKQAIEVNRETRIAIKPKMPKSRAVNPPTILTHPDRLLVPASNVTKAQWADYMQQVAPYIMAYVAQRPLSLLRSPKPDLKKLFFQKHLKSHAPGLAQVQIDDAAYSYLADASGLMALVQMTALELHTWGCKVSNIESVDTLVFDLDPGDDVPPEQTVAAAKTLRKVLSSLGLKSLLKATGGKGLHVVVPGISGCTWPEAKAFSQLVADFVVAKDTPHFTAVMRKNERRGKVFIDYFRNGRGNTAIAVYSPRARLGLPIARPLRWQDLTTKVLLEPWDVPKMVQALQQGYTDPWRRYQNIHQPMDPKMLAMAISHTQT